MAKNILIPVDFCVASLNTLKLAVESLKEEKIEVVLTYAEYLDDSIAELMFYSETKRIESLFSQNPAFEEGLEVIKNRYQESLQDITIKLLHSTNKNYLKKFMDANTIETVFIPKNYRFRLPKRAFDPIDALKKINYPVTEVAWDTGYTQTEQEQLNALFN